VDIELTIAQANHARLDLDIRALFAGRINGVDLDTARQMVVVHVDGDLTAEEQAALQSLVSTHDPLALTPDQISSAQINDVLASADSNSAAIPGWATWTEAEALDWLDANVTDLASAVTALKALARMVVALRNKTWPYLEGAQ